MEGSERGSSLPDILERVLVYIVSIEDEVGELTPDIYSSIRDWYDLTANGFDPPTPEEIGDPSVEQSVHGGSLAGTSLEDGSLEDVGTQAENGDGAAAEGDAAADTASGDEEGGEDGTGAGGDEDGAEDDAGAQEQKEEKGGEDQSVVAQSVASKRSLISRSASVIAREQARDEERRRIFEEKRKRAEERRLNRPPPHMAVTNRQEIEGIAIQLAEGAAENEVEQTPGPVPESKLVKGLVEYIRRIDAKAQEWRAAEAQKKEVEAVAQKPTEGENGEQESEAAEEAASDPTKSDGSDDPTRTDRQAPAAMQQEAAITTQHEVSIVLLSGVPTDIVDLVSLVEHSCGRSLVQGVISVVARRDRNNTRRSTNIVPPVTPSALEVKPSMIFSPVPRAEFLTAHKTRADSVAGSIAGDGSIATASAAGDVDADGQEGGDAAEAESDGDPTNTNSEGADADGTTTADGNGEGGGEGDREGGEGERCDGEEGEEGAGGLGEHPSIEDLLSAASMSVSAAEDENAHYMDLGVLVALSEQSYVRKLTVAQLVLAMQQLMGSQWLDVTVDEINTFTTPDKPDVQLPDGVTVDATGSIVATASTTAGGDQSLANATGGSSFSTSLIKEFLPKRPDAFAQQLNALVEETTNTKYDFFRWRASATITVDVEAQAARFHAEQEEQAEQQKEEFPDMPLPPSVAEAMTEAATGQHVVPGSCWWYHDTLRDYLLLAASVPAVCTTAGNVLECMIAAVAGDNTLPTASAEAGDATGANTTVTSNNGIPASDHVLAQARLGENVYAQCAEEQRMAASSVRAFLGTDSADADSRRRSRASGRSKGGSSGLHHAVIDSLEHGSDHDSSQSPSASGIMDGSDSGMGDGGRARTDTEDMTPEQRLAEELMEQRDMLAEVAVEPLGDSWVVRMHAALCRGQTPRILGLGGLPLEEPPPEDRGLQMSELLCFSSLAPADLHRQRHLSQLRDMLSAKFAEDARAWSSVTQRRLFEALAPQALPQELGQERVTEPVVLRRYYELTDQLLMALHWPAPPQRVGYTNWHPRRCLRMRPTFFDFLLSSQVPALTPRVQAAAPCALSGISAAELASCMEDTMIIQPADHAIVRVRQFGGSGGAGAGAGGAGDETVKPHAGGQPPGDSQEDGEAANEGDSPQDGVPQSSSSLPSGRVPWLSVYSKGNLYGLRCRVPQQPAQVEADCTATFVAEMENGVRVSSVPGNAYPDKPDGFASIGLVHSMPDTSRFVHYSDGSIAMYPPDVLVKSLLIPDPRIPGGGCGGKGRNGTEGDFPLWMDDTSAAWRGWQHLSGQNPQDDEGDSPSSDSGAPRPPYSDAGWRVGVDDAATPAAGGVQPINDVAAWKLAVHRALKFLPSSLQAANSKTAGASGADNVGQDPTVHVTLREERLRTITGQGVVYRQCVDGTREWFFPNGCHAMEGVDLAPWLEVYGMQAFSALLPAPSDAAATDEGAASEGGNVATAQEQPGIGRGNIVFREDGRVFAQRCSAAGVPLCEWHQCRVADAEARWELDTLSKCAVSAREDGTVFVRYPDKTQVVHCPDGTSLVTSPDATQVAVRHPAYPTVDLRVETDHVCRRHAQGHKVAIKQGGEVVRNRTALPDGTAVVTTYDTRVTATICGRVYVNRRDGTQFVATDDGQVLVRPNACAGSEASRFIGPDSGLLYDSKRRRAREQEREAGGLNDDDADEDAGDDDSDVDIQEGAYAFHTIRSTMTVEDHEHNLFTVSMASPFVPEVDLAGEAPGVKAKAVVNEPIEPRLFIVNRDGSAVEAVRPDVEAEILGQEFTRMQGQMAAAAAAGDANSENAKHGAAVAWHKSASARLPRPSQADEDQYRLPSMPLAGDPSELGGNVHTLFSQRRASAIPFEEVFDTPEFMGHPVPPLALSLHCPATTTALAVSRHEQQQQEQQHHQLQQQQQRGFLSESASGPGDLWLRRSVQEYHPLSAEGQMHLVEDVESWQRWRLAREKEMGTFEVIDPRSEEELQAEQDLQKVLDRAYKTARAARKRQKQQQQHKQQQQQAAVPEDVAEEVEDEL